MITATLDTVVQLSSIGSDSSISKKVPKHGYEIAEEICRVCPYKCYEKGEIVFANCGIFRKFSPAGMEFAMKAVTQEKVEELYKWNRSGIESQFSGRPTDIGWQRTAGEWNEQGYDVDFASVFNEIILDYRKKVDNLIALPESINFHDVYEKTIQGNRARRGFSDAAIVGVPE